MNNYINIFEGAYIFALEMIDNKVQYFKSIENVESVSSYHLGKLIFNYIGKDITDVINWDITLPFELSVYNISNDVLAKIPYKIYYDKTEIILNRLINMRNSLQSYYCTQMNHPKFKLNFNNEYNLDNEVIINEVVNYLSTFPDKLIKAIESLNDEITFLYSNKEPSIKSKITVRVVDIYESFEHSSTNEDKLSRTNQELFANISLFIRSIYPYIKHKENNWSSKKMIKIAHQKRDNK